MLHRINAKSDSDELEIITFMVKSEEFFKKRIRIFRYFKSSEIRYIIHNLNENDIICNLIYFLVNTGENYFFALDYNSNKITELKISDQVGILPSFQKLNHFYFITIGSVNGLDTAVNLYDLNINKWYFVGHLSCPRTGSYSILNNNENKVYICGGLNNEGDNTFEVEYFKLKYIGNLLIHPCVISVIKLKNDFLLRKSNPIVLPLPDLDDNTYLICGGQSIFHDTNTCTLFYSDRESIFLSKAQLPIYFSASSRNFYDYKSFLYFFVSDNEVIRYYKFDNNFEIISSIITEI